MHMNIFTQQTFNIRSLNTINYPKDGIMLIFGNSENHVARRLAPSTIRPFVISSNLLKMCLKTKTKRRKKDLKRS